MDWSDLTTKAGAAIGSLLGIFNAWQGWKQRRVSLQVVPGSIEVQQLNGQGSTGQPIYEKAISPSITVVNTSSFPVTVEEVGYEVEGDATFRLSRIVEPAEGRYSSTGMTWIPEKLPQRLEPRTAIKLAWHDRDQQHLAGKRIRRAVVKTACGAIVRARNKSLRDLSQSVKNGQQAIRPVQGTAPREGRPRY